MLYLGIDCGTQGTKAILWDTHKNCITSTAYHSYGLISSPNGRKEQDPASWLQAIKITVKQVLDNHLVSPDQVAGIGISGQQHGLVILDEHNDILYPAKLWCDTEANHDLQKFIFSFNQKHTQNINEIIGIHIPVAFTIAKLIWMKNHKPEIFSKIEKIFLPHEYINFWLTGKYSAESGDASGTGYFDTYNRCWSKKIIDEISPRLYAKLPPIITAEEPSGFLLPHVAKLLGLPVGVPVSSGGGDNMMAAIGTGNICPGILTLSLGTSGTLFTCSNQQINNNQNTNINSFCSSSNSWLPLISTMNMTNAVNAFRDILNIPLLDFERFLSNSSPGANGLICFPWFNGSRFPNEPNMKGSLQGITIDNFTKSNMLRCVVEGVTYKICKGIDEFKQQGLEFNQIRVIGGGAKSIIWCQMIADITGIDVIRPKITEAAALGASLQSHWCHENIRKPEKNIKLNDILPPFLRKAEGEYFKPNNKIHDIYIPLYEYYHIELDRLININN